MGVEFPDFLRGIALIGKYGTTYLPVAVDPTGQLYIVLTGAPDITIPGTVNVDDLNTVKQIQGTDGAVYRTAKVDASGQFIMVPRGQSGNYMAIDANGFMTAVLKGDYGGTLYTIGLDNEGRITAYLVDDVDAFGKINTTGIAELAARLGSPVRFDRRGKVMELETFKDGIGRLQFNYAGASIAYALNPVIFMKDGYSLMCTIAGGAGDTLENIMENGGNWAGKLGFSWNFRVTNKRGLAKCRIAVYTGSTYYYGGLCYDQDNEKLTYLHTDATEHDLTGGSNVKVSANVWNYIKVVVDPSTGKYVRGIFNNNEYDMSALSLMNSASTDAKRFIGYAKLSRTATGTEIYYLDNLVATNAEPA